MSPTSQRGGPGDLPPCSLHRPFGIAGDWHGFPDLLERARHRGVRCMGKGCLCMRSFVIFSSYPSPCRDYPIGDQRLVRVHRHVLNGDLLLAPSAMLVEPFDSKATVRAALSARARYFVLASKYSAGCCQARRYIDSAASWQLSIVPRELLQLDRTA